MYNSLTTLNEIEGMAKKSQSITKIIYSLNDSQKTSMGPFMVSQ